MKRLTITLTEEAREIYESWKPHDRSRKVSEAIINSGKDIFTPKQKKWIMDRIIEAVHTCYKT